MTDVVADDQAAIAADLLAKLRAHPSLAKGYHVPLDAAGHPDPEAVRQVARLIVSVRIQIAPAS
ncbi:MAG TPA: hypothetical protein VH393_10650 [Ktedonobacterales bacterium]